MSALPKVKIAIIGTGVTGPRHAEAVQRESNAELTCIVDPSPAAKAVATSLGVPLYPDVGTMLAPESCDAAIVCTPNHTYVNVSKELLAGGVHVLIEKPISIDIESGKQLVRPVCE
jgi:predicted dehydrogenase